jgi:hypothetical protein
VDFEAVGHKGKGAEYLPFFDLGDVEFGLVLGQAGVQACGEKSSAGISTPT